MNEPSQESNCIVIDAPSPLYSLSVKDEELIEAFSKRNFNDYKRLWSDIASNKLTGNNGEKLSSDTIYNSSDDLLVPYIIDLLRNNKELSQKYDLHPDEPNIYKRLFLAHNDYKKELLQNLKICIDSFQNQLTESLKEIHRTAMKSISYFSDSLANTLIKTLSETVKSYSLNFIPSTEELEQYVSSYKQWGSYGWTAPPDMPFFLFASAPQNQKTANSTFAPYCKNSYLYSLFEKIASESRVHLSDFNVAKQCFLQKNYKSCAQMLFSLIDGVYLRIQPSINENNQWRKAGKQGVTRLKSTLDKSTQEQWLFRQLLNINLTSCLYALYESHQGFQNEPINIINRNFIMHGMGHRKVLHRDCVQLFLLYYNMLVRTRAIPYRR